MSPNDVEPDHDQPKQATPVSTGDLVAAPFSLAARRRLAAWVDTEINNDTLLRRENWPLGLAALITALVVVMVVWLVAAFLATLAKAADITGRAAADWLSSDSIIRTVNSSITAWLDTHAAGLPATSGELGTAWLVIAVVLFLAAIGGSTYARIAWAVVGAATIAAAYAGAAVTTAAATAGITAAVWLLLSLPVYRRRHRGVPADDATR